jgi:hypothetical protein
MRVEILDREGVPSRVLLDGKYHDSVCVEFASWFRETFPAGDADGAEVWRKIPRSGWLTYFLADFDELEDLISSVVTDSNMVDPVVDPEVCERIRQLISLEMVIAAVRRSLTPQ